VDDMSTDNSYKIVEKIAKKDDRLKLFKNKENSGVSVARNLGIENSKGRYLVFLDADDLFMPEKLKKQVEFMKMNDVALTQTGYEKINEDGSLRGVVSFPIFFSYNDSLKGNLMKCFAVMIDTKKLGKKHFKTYKLSEDHIYWLEILKEVDGCYGIEEPLGKYRIIENSRSSNKLDAVRFQWKIIHEIEKISFFKSIYYFINYLWYGYKRYKV
ncbi:MAG: glycosyltransferase family 2 protein, partial [Psychrilyobacter sp.]|nr:glycosyltransferase family 2 protein [Psychrilyobacter sp.]